MTAETRTADQALDRAITELGRLEERAGQQRVYFDDLEGWIGLEIERDDNGNFVSGTLAGSSVDEDKVKRIQNQLDHAKLYYLLDERRFIGPGLDSINRGLLADAITARAKEMIEESSATSDDEDDATS